MQASRLAAIVSSGRKFAPPLPATPFASTVAYSSLTFTPGGAVTAITPVVFSGGVQPYNITVSPLIPGLTVRATDGQINAGTAGSATASTVYRFTGVDAQGATTFKDVTITIATPSALISAFQVVPNPDPHGYTGEYETEAPTTGSTTDYRSVQWFNGLSIPPLSNISTTSVSGVLRLGPVTDSSGLPMIRHVIYPGDPLRNTGQRSEIAYGLSIMPDVEYWFAWFSRMDSDWTHASSNGTDDRQTFGMQIHQDGNSPANSGPSFATNWKGTNPLGAEIVVQTIRYNSSGSPLSTDVRFNIAANPGVMQRFIVRYKASLTSGAILEMWVANGTGSFVQLTDQSPGALWGDPYTNSSRPDFPKTGMDKYGVGVGTRSKTGMNVSSLYFGQGTGLYNDAVNAVAPGAVA